MHSSVHGGIGYWRKPTAAAETADWVCWLLSAYCLTILMHCGWRCRQRLYATAGDSEFCPPCIGSAKVLTFFFVFFAANLIPKKEKKWNADVFFGRKIKRRKIKKCVFWRRKIKRKRNSVGLYCEPLSVTASRKYLWSSYGPQSAPRNTTSTHQHVHTAWLILPLLWSHRTKQSFGSGSCPSKRN